MIAVYANALLILLASVVIGRALLVLLGEGRPTWLAAPAGFATLVIAAPFLVRLPGRATTAAVVIALLLIGALAYLRATRVATTGPSQHGREKGAMHGSGAAPVVVALVAVAVTLAAASLPFLFNNHTGVLGEGIYTNDHAAQLYWADWLQNGFGPQPSAVQFGYPVGPQSVAVISAQSTGADLVQAFNGLLLAIPALTALTALVALGGMPPLRRILVASLTALPYLAVSFLAQSAFKETAMAMLLLAFAVSLAMLASHVSPDSRGQSATRPEAGASRRAIVAVVALLAVASVFTYSLPGLAWFVLALPVWLVLEALAGRTYLDLGRARDAIASHRALAAGTTLIVLVIAAVAIGPAATFIDKVGDVQASAGRLSSPVFPGEALGVWPEGDFRLVRGDVSGAIPATLLGLVAVGLGVLYLIRRRDNALLAVLGAAAVVYVGARLFAQIHVEAKALAVMAPLAMLVALRSLLAPAADGETRHLTIARNALGAGFAIAAVASTFLALRAAPVGFDQRAEGLERLGEQIDGDSVVFLGVDRFAAYRLRGTLIRSPGGYVPPEIGARPEKVWQQGTAMDFDTVDPGKLDKFDYAITTAAAYQSTPPANFEQVATEGDYVLWKRNGPTERSRILDGEGEPPGNPGAPFGCDVSGGAAERKGEATVLADPVLAVPNTWFGPERVSEAAGGQENAFLAPATASTDLNLPAPGPYRLSLQYQSQVPLAVLVEGREVAELPPSLDGMYLTGAGKGAFWPAGELESGRSGTRTVAVRAAEPTGLQDALGVDRRVWLGNLGASPVSEPRRLATTGSCGLYVDRFTLDRPGKG